MTTNDEMCGDVRICPVAIAGPVCDVRIVEAKRDLIMPTQRLIHRRVTDMAKSTDANWQDIDVASLPQTVQGAYEEYKVAQRAAASLREAFENSVRAIAPAPTGMRMVFGYRFGKLSAALVEDEGKPSKAKPKATLADFLAGQAAGGRAA